MFLRWWREEQPGGPLYCTAFKQTRRSIDAFKNQIKVFYEDVCVCGGGLFLVSNWAISKNGLVPRGETGRTLPSADHLKQRLSGGKGWEAGVHKAKRCRRRGCCNLCAQPWQTACPASPTGNQEEQRLLKSLPRMVQKPQTSCRLLTSSAESYRSSVDRRGECANGVGKCCFGCSFVWLFPPTVPPRVSLSLKPLRKDCLSSAAPGFG